MSIKKNKAKCSLTQVHVELELKKVKATLYIVLSFTYGMVNIIYQTLYICLKEKCKRDHFRCKENCWCYYQHFHDLECISSNITKYNRFI